MVCADWNQEKYPELGTMSLRQSNSCPGSSLCEESTVGGEDELTGYSRTELEAQHCPLSMISGHEAASSAEPHCSRLQTGLN